MKTLLALVLVGVSSFALADEVKTAAAQPVLEQYDYSTNLDIAKVISQTLPQGCEAGEARMVYLDSKGEQHTLIYQRTGEDCRY